MVKKGTLVVCRIVITDEEGEVNGYDVQEGANGRE